MLAAKSDVQVDTPEVRVTEWRLAPGSATGHHTHGMDYVIVPVTSGEMTIVAPTGERSKAQLAAGNRSRGDHHGQAPGSTGAEARQRSPKRLRPVSAP